MAANNRTFLLVNQPLDPATIGPMLGRFVSDPRDPLAEFVPKRTECLADALASTDPPQENTLGPRFKLNVGRGHGISGLLRLLNLIRAEASSQEHLRVLISCRAAKTTRIQQFRDVYETLINNEDIKKQLLALLKKNSGVAYMVAGVLVLSDGNLCLEGEKQRDATGKGVVPDPTGYVGSYGQIGMAANSKAMGSVQYSWKGERLLAVQYYKVVKKLSGNGKVEKRPFASKSAVYGQVAGESSEEEDDDLDIVTFEKMTIKDFGPMIEVPTEG